MPSPKATVVEVGSAALVLMLSWGGCTADPETESETDVADESETTATVTDAPDDTSTGGGAEPAGDSSEDDGAEPGGEEAGDDEAGDPAEPDPDAEVVEFRIPAGLGHNAWNTPDTPIVVYVGQSLRVHNDDAIEHAIHASGTPLEHGLLIAPGGMREHLILEAYTPPDTDPDTWDHDGGRDAPIWIVAHPAP